MRKDAGGEFWTITSGAIIGATISAGMELGMQLVAGGEIDLVSIGFAALGGAASGALAATGLKRIGEMVGNAAIGGVGGFIGKDGIKAKGSAYREGLDNLNSLKGNIKLAISDPKGYKQRLETAINMHQVNSKNAVKKTTARFALASLFSVVADRCSG